MCQQSYTENIFVLNMTNMSNIINISYNYMHGHDRQSHKVMELDIHIPHLLRFTEGKGYAGTGWSSCSPIFHMLGQKIFLFFRTMFKLH